MFHWHEEDCRRPDVVFSDGLKVPSCLNCGNVGQTNEAEHEKSVTAIPETPSGATFELRWPSSLPFVEDVAIDDTVEETPRESHMQSQNGSLNSNSSPTQKQSLLTQRSSQTSSIYKSLYKRQIRLVRLLPGRYRDPIRCELRTADLASKPDYEALSYTWADLDGDTSKCQGIYIGARWDILAVTANCVNALRRLRLPTMSRELWVDAVCINQNDNNERSHQVGLMQYIYASASRVLIYLGEDPEDPNPEPLMPWTYVNHGNTLSCSRNLSLRPYFSRIWVIQEIASARSAWVLCGSRGGLWEDFITQPIVGAKHISVIDTDSTVGSDPYDIKGVHRWLFHVAQPRFRELDDFYDLLGATAPSLASDPRDKIFALLGLFQGTQSAGLVADYSLSQNQLSTGITAFFLVRNPESRAHIFSLVRPNSSPNLPSWAVDWAASCWPQTKFPQHNNYLDRSRQLVDFEQLAKIRFHPKGALVMRGFLTFGLGSYLDADLITELPENIQGSTYSPEIPQQTRHASTCRAERAQNNDRAFLSLAVPGYLLMLQHVRSARVYSFVGISPMTKKCVWTTLINSINPHVTLTFSAWNVLMCVRDARLWSNIILWDVLKTSCKAIKQSWNLEVKAWTRKFILRAARVQKTRSQRPYSPDSKALNQLGQIEAVNTVDQWEWLHERMISIYEEARWRAIRSTEYEKYPKWEPSMRLSEWASKYVAKRLYTSLEAVLVQACWDWGRYENPEVDIEFSGSKAPDWTIPRKLLWDTEYVNHQQVESFILTLATTFGPKIENDGWEQKLRYTMRDPQSFIDFLLGQSLNSKQEAMRRLKKMYNHDEDPKHQDSTEAQRSAAIVRWLQTSLDFRREDDLQPGQSSWADSLKKSWAKLGRPVSDDKRSRKTIRSLTKRFRARKSKWAPLLELVRQTEALMLPMEKVLTVKDEQERFFHWLEYLRLQPEEIHII